MVNPLFSICVPAYKVVFLEECITSILKQTYKNFELIILNDCSPQPIKQVIEKFNDSRISYYENDINVGSELLVNTWNKALEYANGEYIVMMGDDDRLETNYLEVFNYLVQKFPNASVYHCRSKIINEESVALMLTPSWPERETVYDSIWHRLNNHRAQYISDFVYRIDLLRGVGGFYYLPLAWGSDDITAFIATSINGIAHTNESIFNYRTNSHSITSTGNGALKMDAVKLYFKWLEDFLEIVPISYEDKIIHRNLKINYRKLYQKRKMQTITSSLGKNWIKQSIKWYFKRKEHQLSAKEVCYAVFDFIKKRLSKKTY